MTDDKTVKLWLDEEEELHYEIGNVKPSDLTLFALVLNTMATDMMFSNEDDCICEDDCNCKDDVEE